MISKILEWIRGKDTSSGDAAIAPYKIETPPQRVKNAQGRFVADDPATPENEAWVGGVAPAKKTKSAKIIPIAEVAAIEVSAKFKKADLMKMTKAELQALAAQRQLEVKSRASKEELVKVIMKS